MRTDTALTPIRRILVGGPPAGGRGAVEAGARLAKRLDAELRIVQVQEPHSLLERLGLVRDPAQIRSAVTDADVIHLAHREGLRPEGYETETLRGQPRGVLVDEVERWQADLLIVGAREHEAPGVGLGSVAEHLIRQASCPVLVVNGSRPIPPRRVLFPVDLSSFAFHSAACGLNFLDQVIGSSDEVTECEVMLAVPSSSDPTIQHAEAGRQGLRDWLEGSDLENRFTEEAVEGPAAKAIVDRALAAEFDLIVMGTHGHGSQHPLPLRGIGSVTGEVLDRAPCHLLVVPPRAEFGAELAEAVASQTEPDFSPRSTR